MYITDPVAVQTIVWLTVVFLFCSYLLLVRYIVSDKLEKVAYTIVFALGIFGVLLGGGFIG
jgi:hypothetical protein